MVLATVWIANLLASFIDKVIGRHAGKLVILSLLLTALSVTVIALRHNINSDFKALLPSTSEAALAMDEIDARVGGGSSLFVVIDSPDKEANLRFAQVYSDKLRETPGVALAHYHNDKAFFEQRQLLYLDAEDLEALYTRVKDRIKQAKRAANPLFVDLGGKKKTEGDEGKDAADLDALQEKYADRMVHQGYKEYLMSDDGYAVVIIVRFVESSTNLVATNKLINEVRQMSVELKPKSYNPKLVVEFGGGLASRQKQYKSIVDDIQTSAIFTILGVFFLIAFYFGRFRAIAVVLVPLVMSVLWTLATAFLIFGELTAITVFIFAILLGLGIDFGIHLLSGYDHARYEGEPVEAALKSCYQSTGRATIIGGLTTFVTFVVLSFAQFRGLSQFGFVASIGILYTLGAMLVVLPSMVLVLHRIRPYDPTPNTERIAERLFTQPRVDRGVRIALPVALILGLVGSIWALDMAPKLGFEENFYKVGEVDWPWERMKSSQDQEHLRVAMKQGSNLARYIDVRAEQLREEIDPATFVPKRRQTTLGQKYTNAVQGKQTSMPTILLFDDAVQTEQTYQRMEAALLGGELKTIRDINAIYSFMPGSKEEQEARMVPIRKLRELLEGESLSFVKKAEREKLEDLKKKTQIEPFSIYDLPDWTKRLFREAGPAATPAAPGQEFAFERLIYVTEKISLLDGPAARDYMSEIRETAKPELASFRVGSQAYVYIAMLDEIRRDGLKMMSIALALVFLILVIGFKGRWYALLAIMPLLVGGLWTAGLAAWLGVRLDFFNMVIIPALIGIGVDDGVHFTMRYVELGRGSLPVVLRQVGLAVVMTSVTSMVGFGGLAITNYAGLKSIGYLAIVGILATLLATLLLLPTTIWLFEAIGARRAKR